MSKLLSHISGKYQRTVADLFCRRMVTIKSSTPFVSFSFDDAPRTAFRNGGNILKAYGITATFFVSLGLLGSTSSSGNVALPEDLSRAVEEGHELGCHTFDHKNPWETTADDFEQSVLKNRKALSRILPDYVFTTFAYPLCNPRPTTKRRIGKLFNCCRGGGQTFNVGKADLNLLKAYFLDVRNGENIDLVKRLIDWNSEVQGWLIFATHDVDDNPSRYGCTMEFFEEVVRYSILSGASMSSIGKTCQKLMASC